MADIKTRVRAEMENISRVLVELEKLKNKQAKSIPEIAGMGVFLDNFYTGIENILKQILSFKGVIIEDSESWHRDLLMAAVHSGVISEEIKEKLKEYLAFRSFFRHSYSFILEESRVRPLAEDLPEVWERFDSEISEFLNAL